MGLANPTPVGQADRLETQERADVVVGVQRPPGSQIPSSLGDPSLFSLRSSNGCKRFTYIMEGYMLYLKSSDLNNHLI